MKEEKMIYLVLLLLTASVTSPVFVPSSRAQPSVPFEITRIGWGTDPDNPLKAYPGDTDQSLTVQAQNLSPNDTIKGVKAALTFEDGIFTDIYGNPNASATGEPEIGDILNPTDAILPKGFFTLTFNLDVASAALPRVYRYEMILSYAVNMSGTFLDGEPKTLEAVLVISKIETSITCSVSPQTILKDETVDLSGTVSPARDDASISLRYQNPNGSEVTRTVKTDVDGSYQDALQPDVEGSWKVNASWLGDEQQEGSWAMTSFQVRFRTIVHVTILNNHLLAGLDNTLNMTIVNDGEIRFSEIEATLNIPPPLVMYGDNDWSFDHLDPGNSAPIAVTVFVPDSAIGSTYTGSLNINYRDFYGETRSETHTVGLIIAGQIELIVYDEAASYESGAAQRISLTATILNKGNAAARYVNCTIVSNSILDLTKESSTYIGEIEENSPTPFTLVARLKDDVHNGTYGIIVRIQYRDYRYKDQSFDLSVPLIVVKTSGNQNDTNGSRNFGPYVETILLLATIAAATLAIIVFYQRRIKAKQNSAKE